MEGKYDCVICGKPDLSYEETGATVKMWGPFGTVRGVCNDCADHLLAFIMNERAKYNPACRCEEL